MTSLWLLLLLFSLRLFAELQTPSRIGMWQRHRGPLGVTSAGACGGSWNPAWRTTCQPSVAGVRSMSSARLLTSVASQLAAASPSSRRIHGMEVTTAATTMTTSSRRHKSYVLKFVRGHLPPDLKDVNGPIGALYGNLPDADEYGAFKMPKKYLDHYKQVGYVRMPHPALDPRQCDKLADEVMQLANDKESHPKSDLLYGNSLMNMSEEASHFHCYYCQGQWRASWAMHDLIYFPAFTVPSYQILGESMAMAAASAAAAVGEDGQPVGSSSEGGAAMHPMGAAGGGAAGGGFTTDAMGGNGGAVRLWYDEVLMKLPKKGPCIPWQQNYSRWQHTTPCHNFVTVAIALDTLTKDRSALCVIAGSHRWREGREVISTPPFDAKKDEGTHINSIWDFVNEEEREMVLDTPPETIELQRGQALFLHPMTLYCTHANRSLDTSKLLFLHYMATPTFTVHAGPLLPKTTRFAANSVIHGPYFPVCFDPAMIEDTGVPMAGAQVSLPEGSGAPPHPPQSE